ncbi:methyl-accepting chemotaxis protein [Ferrimonas pelagia]|uniref:Methyl-accepting chemotaxis protein n=1 Tax=Ferrimonas pelagia TaxID=1177826 RepID=A0ABP9EVY2_9GAMM
MNSNKTSLKLKLSGAAALAIVLCGLVITVAGYASSVSRTDRDIAQQLDGVTTTYNHYVKDWLRAKGLALQGFPVQHEADALPIHLSQVRDSGGFDNVFLAYPDGTQSNANGVVLPPDNNDPRIWDWYIHAQQQRGEVVVENPTVAAATGATVVSMGITVPVEQGLAVLGADVEIADLIAQLNRVVLPGLGSLFIVNEQNRIFAHSDNRLLNQTVNAQTVGITPAELGRLGNSQISVNGVSQYLYTQPIDGTRFTTVVLVERDSVLAPIRASMGKTVALALLVVAICAALFGVMCQYLFRPLSYVSDALAEIAAGGGDLTQRIQIDSKDEIGTLADSFNAFVGTLQQLIGHMQLQARTLGELAESGELEANRSAEQLVEQQNETRQVATAIRQMAIATEEIASHAEGTSNEVERALAQSQQGGAMVELSRESIEGLSSEVTQATTVINELDKHAQAIDSILSNIQGIAEQTNLLALNAAIEAARAGESGRGFSVVADEVRVLSQRTQDSASEIQQMITTLQQSTQQAVQIMRGSSELAGRAVDNSREAATSLADIRNSTQQITEMVTQIATAVQEQTAVASEVTANTVSIKSIADGLVQDSEEARTRAQALRKESRELGDKIGEFSV